MDKRELEDRIEKIIDKNCILYPYEGYDIDKSQLKQEIMEVIDEINDRYEYNPVKDMREARDRKICG